MHITIDAMGCQKEIARQIVDGSSDYLLAVKSNQGELYGNIKDVFECAAREGTLGTLDVEADHQKQVDKGHARLESRECWVRTEPAELAYVDPQGRWAGLRRVAKINYRRGTGEKTQTDTRYYICSYRATAASLLQATRDHWGIENSLHWVLDVAFDEDRCRVRTGHADQNLAVARHCALNLLKQERTGKVGIKAKRKKAGWDYPYLLKVLSA